VVLKVEVDVFEGESQVGDLVFACEDGRSYTYIHVVVCRGTEAWGLGCQVCKARKS